MARRRRLPGSTGRGSWFIERGGDPRPAKEVCARCLVGGECRAWALDQGPGLEGMWAGSAAGTDTDEAPADGCMSHGIPIGPQRALPFPPWRRC